MRGTERSQDQHGQGQKFPRVEDRSSAEATARHSLGIGALLVGDENGSIIHSLPFPCLSGIALKEPEGGSNLDDPPMPVAGADKRGSGTAGIRDLLLVASFASIDSWPAVKRFFMCPFPSLPFFLECAISHAVVAFAAAHELMNGLSNMSGPPRLLTDSYAQHGRYFHHAGG